MALASVNGLDIAYDERGEGEPLVLIMGFGAQRCVWHPEFCDLLAARGFRVIRLDNRDVGASTWMNGARAPSLRDGLLLRLRNQPVPAPYDLSDMAGDVVGLLDALDVDAAHVVGASMGGMIAQHVAIEHPGRCLSLTSIMSGPGSRRHQLCHPRALHALLSSPPPRSREEAMASNEVLFRVIGGKLPIDMEFIRQRAGDSFDVGYNGPGVVRHFAAMLASGSRMEGLRQLTIPAAVIHGTADPLVPWWAGHATARAIPGASWHPIRRMGHELVAETWPQAVAAIAGVAERARG